jgi:hypothetical protein
LEGKNIGKTPSSEAPTDRPEEVGSNEPAAFSAMFAKPHQAAAGC